MTGSNPAVESIYRRLLTTHPALKGHATSLGKDGSTVDDLPRQVTAMLALNPLPDVVVIQGIDNDMKCNGTDPANQKRYAVKLGKVLDTINQHDRYAQIYLVDQPISTQTWTDATKHLQESVYSSKAPELLHRPRPAATHAAQPTLARARPEPLPGARSGRTGQVRLERHARCDQEPPLSRFGAASRLTPTSSASFHLLAPNSCGRTVRPSSCDTPTHEEGAVTTGGDLRFRRPPTNFLPYSPRMATHSQR